MNMKKHVCIVLCALVLSQFLILPASAFTINSAEITILDNGNAIVDLRYSMNWLEKLFLRNKFEVIQSKFSEWLEKDVMIREYNEKSGYISLGIFDFVHETIDSRDGYWMSYQGFTGGKGTLYGIIPVDYKIGRVEVFFPDGYVRVHRGSVPSDVHFVNHELTSYYYNSQYYRKVYDKSYGVYDSNNYKHSGYINKVAKYWGEDLGFNELVISAGSGSIFASSLPLDVQAVSTLSSLSDATVGVLNKPMELTQQVMDSGAVEYYLKELFGKYPQISSNMKKMSELKAEEALLLEALLSEGESAWSENLDLVIANLNTQKEILNELKKDTNEMLEDVQYAKESGMFQMSEVGVSYIISLAEASVQVTENDLANVEGQLRYLKSSPTSPPSPTPVEETVKILSHDGYVDYLYGCFKVVGEVQNDLQSNIEHVKVTATFYDSRYNVIDTVSPTTEIRILQPGQKSPFEILCSGKTNKPSSYKLSVSYSETEDEPFEGLEILRHSSETTKQGFHKIVGEVKNNGMADAEFVDVIVTYYDISDDVIGTACCYISPRNIASGATASFEILATPMNVRHARYELQVQGR
jgi:hypothetical protein